VSNKSINEAATWYARMRSPEAARYEQAFSAWLAKSPDHAIAYAEQERSFDASKFLADREFVRDRSLSRARINRKIPILLAAAAAIALVAAGTAVVLYQRNSSEASQTQDRWVSFTAGDNLRKIGLADGSLVTLDRNTQISVLLNTASRRILLKSGRARFDVFHDPSRPFSVQAGTGEVIALGTLFDVSLQPGTGAMRVRLMRGAVRVNASTSRTTQIQAMLVPGEQAVVSGTLDRTRMSQADRASWGWDNGIVAFDAVPLAMIASESHDGNGPPVLLATPELGRLLVSGALDTRDRAALARKIANAFDLAISVAANGAITLAPKK